MKYKLEKCFEESNASHLLFYFLIIIFFLSKFVIGKISHVKVIRMSEMP